MFFNSFLFRFACLLGKNCTNVPQMSEDGLKQAYKYRQTSLCGNVFGDENGGELSSVFLPFHALVRDVTMR